MDEFQVEVSSLKHNFWQILNLSKQLLARNEVLKAKIKEQERSYEWKTAEMQKSIDDLKRKNMFLQKKLATDDDGVSVVTKEYEEVVKGSFSQTSPREAVHRETDLEGGHNEEDSSEHHGDEQEDNEEYTDENHFSEESEKNSANSV